MIKKIAIAGIAVVCLLVAWVYTEKKSVKAVRPPTGATNFVTFIAADSRFSEIRKFTYQDKLYLQVIGQPYQSVLSVPSGPPAYVFDETGAFVDWSRDIGDQPSFVKKWGGFSNATNITAEQAKQLIEFR